MAYNQDKITEEAIKAIQKEKLTFFEEIALFVEPSLATLYNWKLEELEAVKSALAFNRVQRKKKMRNKWEESDNATLQLAAYKLIADDEDLKRLTMNKFEHTGKDGGSIKTEHKLIIQDFSGDSKGSTTSNQ